jgi:hypothetical protein
MSNLNRDFYKALGIQRNANQEEIKKAYRKMALKYHPDKAGSGAEVADQFELVQKAYETLSDVKLKRVYDQYGEKGLQMLQQMGEYAPFIDPEVLLQINRIFTGFSFVVALLILFPSLLSARIEENIMWSYILVFIPLFIVDAILLVFIITASFEKQDDDVRLESDRSKSTIFKVLTIVYVGLFCIFQFLICAKLDGITLASWWMVSIPWFLLELMNWVQITASTAAQASEPFYESNEASEPKFYGFWGIVLLCVNNYSMFVVRLVQAGLVFWKLNGADCDWRLIFMPTWFMGLIEFVKISYAIVIARRTMKPEPYRMAIAQMVVFFIWGSLFYTFMGLLVNRLESSVNLPTVAVILIPLFIVLGILFCCCCCCLPCTVAAAKQQFDEDMMDDSAPIEVVVSSDHRITIS